METARIKVNRVGGKKLQFVKVIYTTTGWGLKEAKDWCDKVNESPGQYFYIPVFSVEQFKREIKLNGIDEDYNLTIDDRNSIRNTNLVLLGLGDKSDKINLISEKLSLSLYNEIKNNNSKSTIYEICKAFTEDLLDGIDEFNLDKLLTKTQENG